MSAARLTCCDLGVVGGVGVLPLGLAFGGPFGALDLGPGAAGTSTDCCLSFLAFSFFSFFSFFLSSLDFSFLGLSVLAGLAGIALGLYVVARSAVWESRNFLSKACLLALTRSNSMYKSTFSHNHFVDRRWLPSGDYLDFAILVANGVNCSSSSKR